MEDIFYRFRWQLTSLLVGIAFVGGGIYLSRQSSTSQQVQVINDGVEPSESSEVVIEISGEVNSPGVYKLASNARVDDALKLAGGLTENADMDWISKTVNRAGKINDGQKIYIPARNASHNEAGEPGVLSEQSSLVNVNTASQSGLEALWGIGPVTAQSIIEQRPYSAVEELLSRKILKQNVYDKIKDQLSVF